jgi:hypothetical protein
MEEVGARFEHSLWNPLRRLAEKTNVYSFRFHVSNLLCFRKWSSTHECELSCGGVRNYGLFPASAMISGGLC